MNFIHPVLILAIEFDLIQSVAATPADSTRLLIAGGLSDDTSSDIYLWEKQVGTRNIGDKMMANLSF